ncbi:MAG: signal recognition particle-docking protein FtsY [FCB group bacterium]|nr:signal recognition particle-docking protein FtsY [FCB group bacterium]
MSILSSLKNALSRTKENLNIGSLFKIHSRLDENFFDELEEVLYTGDLGADITEPLLDSLRKYSKHDNGEAGLKNILRDELVNLLPTAEETSDTYPLVVLLAGVNGCGKTTTAGKLAYRYIQAGKKVAIAACDTFRAAAVEQLEMWGQRAGARVVRQKQGADPASVAYDALQSTLSRGEDVLIVDTAGRLHSKTNLMAELEKISRVMKKLLPEAPHETLLVLDAVIGQNSIQQASVFTKKAGVTGLVIPKPDGPARGGAALTASKQFNLPIKYIGVGEKIDDLLKFDSKMFVEELLD